MNFLGLSIGRAKAAVGVTDVPASALSDNGGWWRTITESFSGAWQRNVVIESERNLLAFSAVYACVSMIANDIAKLNIRLMEYNDKTGIWTVVARNSPFWPVIRKPNGYQTRIQFITSWIVSKLLYGNTYVLKERDARRIVVALHVLDPRLVKLLVADDGGVYYELAADRLSRGFEGTITIPATEMIHDRAVTLWHPLIGVSPIYACGTSATQGIRIQANSAAFFENMSRPSGQLTAPNAISDPNAARLKAEFEKNFSGGKIGRLLVTGDGLKYEPIGMPASDSQLIEQLKWTVEDVARCFQVPLHKLATGQNPTFTNVSAMNQEYYSQTLQAPIEALELLLDEGLELGRKSSALLGVELDIGGLLRMDSSARAEAGSKKVAAGIISINEARVDENLSPVEGGETPYLQQQNWPIAALAARPAPGSTPEPVATPVDDPTQADDAIPAESAEEKAAELLAEKIIARFSKELA
jgi:HK97 family phage portal protein